MHSSFYSIVLITVPDQKTADDISGGLLQNRLAACVNIIPKITSRYWWEGEIEEAQELLLLAKTRTTLVPEIMLYTKQHHPYTQPEIIGIKIAEGDKTYLDWIGSNCRFTRVPKKLEIKKKRPE
jgi:periplasmic divalent cation tolerance protein